MRGGGSRKKRRAAQQGKLVRHPFLLCSTHSSLFQRGGGLSPKSFSVIFRVPFLNRAWTGIFSPCTLSCAIWKRVHRSSTRFSRLNICCQLHKPHSTNSIPSRKAFPWHRNWSWWVLAAVLARSLTRVTEFRTSLRAKTKFLSTFRQRKALLTR